MSSVPSSSDVANASASDSASKKDWAWKHCTNPDPDDNNKVKCKFCKHVSNGGIHRFKKHLAGIKGDVSSCKKVTGHVKDKVLQSLNKIRGKKARKRKEIGTPRTRDEEDDHDHADEMRGCSFRGPQMPRQKGPINQSLGSRLESVVVAGQTTLEERQMSYSVGIWMNEAINLKSYAVLWKIIRQCKLGFRKPAVDTLCELFLTGYKRNWITSETGSMDKSLISSIEGVVEPRQTTFMERRVYFYVGAWMNEAENLESFDGLCEIIGQLNPGFKKPTMHELCELFLTWCDPNWSTFETVREEVQRPLAETGPGTSGGSEKQTRQVPYNQQVSQTRLAVSDALARPPADDGVTLGGGPISAGYNGNQVTRYSNHPQHVSSDTDMPPENTNSFVLHSQYISSTQPTQITCDDSTALALAQPQPIGQSIHQSNPNPNDDLTYPLYSPCSTDGFVLAEALLEGRNELCDDRSQGDSSSLFNLSSGFFSPEEVPYTWLHYFSMDGSSEDGHGLSPYIPSPRRNLDEACARSSGEAVVVLHDASTGHVYIITTGPDSSTKLAVVVLEGDFDNEKDVDLTAEEFVSFIVKEREGTRPLLTEDLQVTLKEGVGTRGEITFTNNSSWIRSRKSSLGLKIASGFCEGFLIREGKTAAFTVKDHRGELYKKDYPPALRDEIWGLEKIGKDGSFQKRLRNIHVSGMSNKMWKVLMEHAKTIGLSGKYYIYYSNETRNIGAIFNNIYEFCGMMAGGQFYSAETLMAVRSEETERPLAKRGPGTSGESERETWEVLQQVQMQLAVPDALEQPLFDMRVTIGGR